MFAFAMQFANEGLTLREIIADIPHDFAALVVYVVLGLFVFFIWVGSRPKAPVDGVVKALQEPAVGGEEQSRRVRRR
jgi:hypothetical protein